MSENTNEESQTPAWEESTSADPAPAEPTTDFLSLDEQDLPATATPDLDAVDAPVPATPIAGPPNLNLGDPQQVAQATYGQTQQAYSQPQYQPVAPQTAYPQSYPQSYPQGGYAPGQIAYPPVPAVPGYQQLSWAEENTWASAAHWSALVASLIGLGFAGPLLVYLIKGPQSPRVKAAAAESLNFEITYVIAMVVSVLAMVVLIGLVTTPVLVVAWLILRILAAVAASKGENYVYPMTIRLVK